MLCNQVKDFFLVLDLCSGIILFLNQTLFFGLKILSTALETFLACIHWIWWILWCKVGGFNRDWDQSNCISQCLIFSHVFFSYREFDHLMPLKFPRIYRKLCTHKISSSCVALFIVLKIKYQKKLRNVWCS